VLVFSTFLAHEISFLRWIFSRNYFQPHGGRATRSWERVETEHARQISTRNRIVHILRTMDVLHGRGLSQSGKSSTHPLHPILLGSRVLLFFNSSARGVFRSYTFWVRCVVCVCCAACTRIRVCTLCFLSLIERDVQLREALTTAETERGASKPERGRERQERRPSHTTRYDQCRPEAP